MAVLWFVVEVCLAILVVWVLLIPDTISRMVREKEAISEVENIWNKRWLGNLLLAVGVLCVVVGWWLPIPAGYAITGIAVIAAIMALRPKIGGWERSFWFVIVVFFAAMEIRAINRDRKDQTDKFISTSQGLETAISGLKTTITEGRTHFDLTMDTMRKLLETETETKQNTQPYAYLKYSRFEQLPPGVVAAHESMGFNFYWENTGTKAATDIVQDANIYLAKRDDMKEEQRLQSEFDKWWKHPTHPHWRAKSYAPEDKSAFFTSISPAPTDDDMKHINELTFYMFIRGDYSDGSGRWRYDACFWFQNFPHDFNIAHPCTVNNNPRHVLKPPS